MSELEKIISAIGTLLNGWLLILVVLITFGSSLVWMDHGGLRTSAVMVKSTVSALAGNHQTWDVRTIDRAAFARTGDVLTYYCNNNTGNLQQCAAGIQTIPDPKTRQCMANAIDDLQGPNIVAAVFGQPVFQDGSAIFIIILCSIGILVFSAFVVFMFRPKAADNGRVALVLSVVLSTLFTLMVASIRYDHKVLTYSSKSNISDTAYCMYTVTY